MMRGWVHRARRQVEAIGNLPPLPETVGPAIIPATRGLYVGSTIADSDSRNGSAPSWLDRVVVGDLGFRTKAVLTRYPEGIMVQRIGASPIWIPGKALTHDGILAIRWRLPSGTEIDTGFRGDDRRQLANWVGEDAA